MLEARYEDGEVMTDKHIRDELRTLLFAGHETTMIAIAWVMHYLHTDTDALERTRTEVGSASELSSNPWLEAVVQEALRPKPIIIGVVRQPARDMELGGFDVPAGTLLYVSIAMLNSDPELYPEPYVFRPERFMNRKPKPWEYAPAAAWELASPCSSVRPSLPHSCRNVDSNAWDPWTQKRHVATFPWLPAPGSP